MPDLMRKCGVICRTKEGHQYLFSCIFCNFMLVQLEDFLLHIESKHESSINGSVLDDFDEMHGENIDGWDGSKKNKHYQVDDTSPSYMECEHMNICFKEEPYETDSSHKNEEKSMDVENALDMFYKCESLESETHIPTYDNCEMKEEIISDIECSHVESTTPEHKGQILEIYQSIESGTTSSPNTEHVKNSARKHDDLLNMFGKNMLKCILVACEKHSILWDENSPQTNNSWFREKAYKSIASTIGKLAEWKSVRLAIQRLRIRISNQMRKKKLAETNGESYIPLWESDIIAFLGPQRRKKKKTSVETKNTSSDNKALEKTRDAGIDVEYQKSNEKYACSSPLNIYDEETLVAIFSNYARHDILWNVNEPISKNPKLRQKAFKTIATDIGRSSEWLTIRDICQRLRTRLGKELQKKNLAELNDEPFVPSWEHDLNSFLKPRRVKTYIPVKRKFVLPNSQLTESQCLEFIEIYKSFPCLWDEHDITYRFPNRRQEAMAAIQELLKRRTDVSLTQNELEIEIVRIRKMCSQEKERKLKCGEPNSIYDPDFKFYDKITFLEVDVGPFKCLFCNEFSDSITQYKIHKSSHDGSLPFSCVVCKQGFNSISNLTVHLRRHTKDYIYECDVCHKGFAVSNELITHKRVHSGENPLFCDICGDSFKSGSRLNKHMQRRHSEGVRNYKCEICSKAFSNGCSLLAHRETHSTVRDQLCNVCGKAFKTKKCLRQHKQIHADTKKYVCKICEKPFAQYAGLSGHMKTHGTTLINK